MALPTPQAPLPADLPVHAADMLTLHTLTHAATHVAPPPRSLSPSQLRGSLVRRRSLDLVASSPRQRVSCSEELRALSMAQTGDGASLSWCTSGSSAGSRRGSLDAERLEGGTPCKSDSSSCRGSLDVERFPPHIE
jgi:hypothetical protein